MMNGIYSCMFILYVECQLEVIQLFSEGRGVNRMRLTPPIKGFLFYSSISIPLFNRV